MLGTHGAGRLVALPRSGGHDPRRRAEDLKKVFSEQSHGTCKPKPKPKPDRVVARRLAEMHRRRSLRATGIRHQPLPAAREAPAGPPDVQQLALDLAGLLSNSESCEMLGNRAYAGESYISGYDR